MTRSIRWDGTREHADQIVQWVREHDGEAQIGPGDRQPCVDVGLPDYFVGVRVGDVVIMTDEWFVPSSWESAADEARRAKRRVFRVVGADEQHQ